MPWKPLEREAQNAMSPEELIVGTGGAGRGAEVGDEAGVGAANGRSVSDGHDLGDHAAGPFVNALARNGGAGAVEHDAAPGVHHRHAAEGEGASGTRYRGSRGH